MQIKKLKKEISDLTELPRTEDSVLKEEKLSLKLDEWFIREELL